MIKEVDPREIQPPHSARVMPDLVHDMCEEGWNGRPLLVVECADGRMVAWTGSHRLAAAISANLSTVPCYVIPEESLIRHGHSADEVFVADYERLEAVRKTGDENAVSLMWSEGRE